MTSSLIVFILLGGAVILWILAFIAWADRKASAMDVYWAAGAAVLSCIALPLFAQFNPPTDALTSCVVALCSFGGLLCTIQSLVVGFAAGIAAYEFWNPQSQIGFGNRIQKKRTDRMGGSIFTLVSVCAIGVGLISGWLTVEDSWKLVAAKPWYKVYVAGKQYDDEFGETFLAENSPLYAIYIPDALLQQSDRDAVLKDVTDSIASMKLNIHVGSIVGIIQEDRGTSMDRIVIYREVDEADSTKVQNTRSVRFRNPYDPLWLESVALGIDSLRKSMKATGTASAPSNAAKLGRLNFPKAAAVPTIGQHVIIQAGP